MNSVCFVERWKTIRMTAMGAKLSWPSPGQAESAHEENEKGDLSRLTEVKPTTIRWYEAEGWRPAPAREDRASYEAQLRFREGRPVELHLGDEASFQGMAADAVAEVKRRIAMRDMIIGNAEENLRSVPAQRS